MSKGGASQEVEESNRMWASASFVGVLIIIGLPLWWKTTEVYRVALPYDKISSLDKLPHAIATELVVLANDDPTANEIADLIEKSFENSDVIKLKIKKGVLSNTLHHTLESVADEVEAIEEIGKVFDLTQHNTFYVVQRKPLFEGVWLAGERVAFFRDTRASTSLVEVLKSWVYQTSVLDGARSELADNARQTRVPPTKGHHIVLSVVHPHPEQLKVDFDAGNAVEDYIGTFMDELSVLHNFTIQSQWLYLLNFDFKPKQVSDSSDRGRHLAVRKDRLPLLLTKLESRAATHVSELPTIHLALYATPCSLSPLVIYDNDKMNHAPVQAFMSPKWGGVVLVGPTEAECRDEMPTFSPQVRLVMGTFIAQLRTLIGIVDVDHIENVHLDPLRSVVPRRWEVDSLLRIRTLEQITSAKRTLQSLAQLLGEISNIVINDDVGASITLAVESIEDATELMKRGELVAAYQTSQEAFLAAETAFMEPSLLALLYFPDDQKYAIYIPLFLPIMFPVVLSLKNLLRWFRGKSVHKEKIE